MSSQTIITSFGPRHVGSSAFGRATYGRDELDRCYSQLLLAFRIRLTLVAAEWAEAATAEWTLVWG